MPIDDLSALLTFAARYRDFVIAVSCSRISCLLFVGSSVDMRQIAEVSKGYDECPKSGKFPFGEQSFVQAAREPLTSETADKIAEQDA